VQAVGVGVAEVMPRQDAVGGNDVYTSVNSGGDRAAFERVAGQADAYR